ncbi:MAG: hypothetical protein WC664_04650 [Patescibacteria group bacterium]
MNKKIVISLFICLILVSGVFIFLKNKNQQLSTQFRENHYKLWFGIDQYYLERCVKNQCKIIDKFSTDFISDVVIDESNDLIYFFKDNSLVARDFVNETEKQIYILEPEEKVLNFSLSDNNLFVVLITEDELYKNYYTFDLINNIIKKNQILFAREDEQIIGNITDLGQVEFNIMGIDTDIEGQQYLEYMAEDNQKRYRLTDNYYPYFTIAHKKNHILYFVDNYLKDLDLLSGVVQNKLILDSGHLSSDGRFVIQENNNLTGSEFFLFDLEENKRFLLFKRNSDSFLDGFWANENKYYIFIAENGYYLIDVIKHKVYFSLSDYTKYKDWGLVDVFK